uniref:Putative secreted peptide n=1 Tax=Anopheles braziliensis TaxID=58242 RepID=A0A2M3ZTE3_9DIPT
MFATSQRNTWFIISLLCSLARSVSLLRELTIRTLELKLETGSSFAPKMVTHRAKMAQHTIPSPPGQVWINVRPIRGNIVALRLPFSHTSASHPRTQRYTVVIDVTRSQLDRARWHTERDDQFPPGLRCEGAVFA